MTATPPQSSAAPISDERLNEIERGLEGVQDGPWEIFVQERLGDRATHEEIEIWTDDNNVLLATEVRRAHRDGGRKTMQHIARMDPQTVRSLISALRLERQAKAAVEAAPAEDDILTLAEILWQFGGHTRHGGPFDSAKGVPARLECERVSAAIFAKFGSLTRATTAEARVKELLAERDGWKKELRDTTAELAETLRDLINCSGHRDTDREDRRLVDLYQAIAEMDAQPPSTPSGLEDLRSLGEEEQ